MPVAVENESHVQIPQPLQLLQRSGPLLRICHPATSIQLSAYVLRYADRFREIPSETNHKQPLLPYTFLPLQAWLPGHRLHPVGKLISGIQLQRLGNQQLPWFCHSGCRKTHHAGKKPDLTMVLFQITPIAFQTLK